MKIDTKSKIAFTFASAEVSFFSQQFIKIIEQRDTPSATPNA